MHAVSMVNMSEMLERRRTRSRPRQKDALLQACSLLAFFMHANRDLPPTAAVLIVPRRSVGRAGMRCCFIGKARQSLASVDLRGSRVSVVCRCWAAFSMERCAARRPLCSRYQFAAQPIPSHPIPSHAASASSPHIILGSAQQILSSWPALQGLSLSRHLARCWPGLPARANVLPAACSPAVRHSRAPDYCAHASQGSTERRPSNTCACAGTSVRALARLTLHCMTDHLDLPTIPIPSHLAAARRTDYC